MKNPFVWITGAAIVSAIALTAVLGCSPKPQPQKLDKEVQVTEITGGGPGIYGCYILNLKDTGERFLLVRAGSGSITAVPIKPTTTESK